MQIQVDLANNMFSKDIIKKLGYYVYLYIHPDTERIFYVGKGKGNRAFEHMKNNDQSLKSSIIKELASQNKKPRIEILVHGLKNEKAAYQIESAAIDLLGKDTLTNKVGGWGSGKYGRMSTDELVGLYTQKKVTVTEPALLIRINELYRYGLTPTELYDITRGRWRIGSNRELAQYALSVYDGIVKEVYKIQAWFPAGSTFSTRTEKAPPGRWEFIGSIADDKIRKKYLNKSVKHYFAKASRNPIQYVNIG